MRQNAEPVRFPIAVFAALGVTAIAASAAPAPPAPPPAPKLSKYQLEQRTKFENSAPADEYFGKMKMSYLGMNNTFRDAAISAGEHTTDPGIINKVAYAEDALDAWRQKYPRDPQLARTYFLATQVERKIWTKANQDRAWVYLNRLVALFPDSYFGKLLAKELAIGFTEHYYALPLPCVTPVPVVEPTIDPTFVGPPAPTPEPTETPIPTPPPTPSPMITSAGTHHTIEVIAQACVPPPLPSPSPSPSPAAMPSALISATPSAVISPAPSAPPSPSPT